jgi:DNA-binding GntR family transcriptional regulator
MKSTASRETECPPPTAAATPAFAMAMEPATAESEAAREEVALHIAKALAQAIARRQLLPGTRVTERDIAALFQAERATVRQAVNRLAEDRLLSAPASGVAEVLQPCATETRQVFQLRRMLESSLLLELGSGLAPRHWAALRRQLLAEREALRGPDTSAQCQVLGEFHMVLARALHNDLVPSLLGELVARSLPMLLPGWSPAAAAQEAAAHAAIVDALERRDGSEASRLMATLLFALESRAALGLSSSKLSGA